MGSPAAQSLDQVIDLGGPCRTVDLILSTYRLDPEARAMLSIETSPEATDSDGWVVLGHFVEESSWSKYLPPPEVRP